MIARHPHSSTASATPPAKFHEPGLESLHLPCGHLHWFVHRGVPTTCFIEPRGISRVMARPHDLHPASFTFHHLRFESLRVGGTMIIVRNDREVLEEIHNDSHIYLLENTGYRKIPQSDEIRALMLDDFQSHGHRLIDRVANALH